MLRSTDWTRTESADEPVTVAEVKTQLRITHTEDDGDLENMIAEARAYCETIKLSNRSLMNTTCVDYFDEFDDEMELRWWPVSSITSIAYEDSDGAAQTLATTVYELSQRHGIGHVKLKYGQSWPTTRGDDGSRVVTVTYVAGSGATAASVPLAIRRWIKARVGWMYANRDGDETVWQPYMDSLLAPYSTGRVIG